MHDESVKPLSEQELRELEERELDRRIIAALEQVPDVSTAIPGDFAARVAAKVPAKSPVTVRATNYGRRAMWLGLIVLLAAIVIFSSQRADQSIAIITVECLLVAQFLAIVTWLSLRSSREG